MSINVTDFDFMQKLVAKHSAIVLEKGKEYLLEARLTPIAKNSGISDLTALIQLLRDGKDRLLLQKVIEAMTTNETFFFRDVHPFEALKKVVIPQLLAKKLPGQMLNIWCAASSTGQEPYSIAMLISENFPQLKSQVKIYASDIAPNILEKAKRGLYSQLEVNRGLPVQLLVKFFTKVGAEWQLKDDIRHMVDFRLINLMETFPKLPLMDIIFVRNVLIYFSLETKQIIFAQMRKNMKPDGYLFLGGSETTLNIDDNFERYVMDKATCYRIKSTEPKAV